MSSTAATRRSARSSDPAPHRDAEPRAASATPTGPWRGAAPATPAPQRPAQSVRRDDRRIDLVTVVHIHQHRRGPYRVRAVAFLTALTALALAVWTPQMLAGSHSGAVGLIAGIAAAVYFIGLGANAAVLYQLAHGYPPPVVEPTGHADVCAARRRLWRLVVLPFGLAVRGRG